MDLCFTLNLDSISVIDSGRSRPFRTDASRVAASIRHQPSCPRAGKASPFLRLSLHRGMADRSSQTPGQKEGRKFDSANKERQCVSFSEALENKRLERAKKTGPEPWIIRKLTVGVTLGVLAFEFYAYAARLCVPMLRREGNARGSRPLGGEFSHPSA